MCELLVFLGDNTHYDPEQDRVGCYKRGMVVAVRDDGHSWGRMESKEQWLADGGLAADWPGKFGIIKITGILAAAAAALHEEQAGEDDTGTPILDETLRPRLFRRRRWRLLIDNLPTLRKNQLIGNGVTTITRLQVLAIARRIRDDAAFVGL